MEKETILIHVEVYTYFSKRVKIYSPEYLKPFYNIISISRDEYSKYTQTLYVVAKAVDDMGYQDKVSFSVRPWYIWFWRVFIKKAFRSPVVIIGGEVVSSGAIPDKVKVKEILTKKNRKYGFLEKK